MPRFLVIIERAERNFSAYCPELPGCIATGETEEETLENMKEAITLHLEGLKAEGLPCDTEGVSVRQVEVPF